MLPESEKSGLPRANFFSSLPADAQHHRLLRDAENQAMYKSGWRQSMHGPACPAPPADRPRTAARATQKNAAAYADAHPTECRALLHAPSSASAPGALEGACKVRSG